MENADFVQTNVLATVLTLLVTLATCVISKITEYRKIKIENFELLYKCLTDLASKRAEIIAKCNTLASDLANNLPENWNNVSNYEMEKSYRNTCSGINKIASEYSNFLDFFLSFSHLLYKNKPIIPIIKADCWAILRLFEIVNDKKEYSINYSQIASLAEFILLYGNRTERKVLRIYMEKNKISKLMNHL